MVSTDVELCNHALSLLGESRIENLEQDNERARICNLFYAQTRDSLLSMYQWPFAVKRVSLAMVDEENLTAYQHRYALPNDYLKMIDMIAPNGYSVLGGGRYEPYTNTADTWNTANVGVRYQIEGNRLLTDMSPCIIRYTARVVVPGRFPELFVDTLVPAIAAKIAPRLSQNFELANQLSMLSSNAFLRATAELNQDALTRPPRQVNISEIN